MGISTFVDVLLSSPRGKIIACNLLDGLNDGLYDQTFMQDLFDWWSGLFVWRHRTFPGFVRSIDSLVNTLSLVLSDIPAGFRPGRARPVFRLRCQHRARTKLVANYLHVIGASFFYGSVLTTKARERLARRGALALHVRSGRAKTVHKSKLGLRDLSTTYQLGRPNEAVFLTSRASLLHFEKQPNPANAARDLLGLVHKPHGDELVALSFSCPSLGAHQIVRPTIGDAGVHRRFKTIPDSRKNRTRKAKGIAVNLQKFANGNTVLDGLGEVVIHSMPFAEIADIQLIPLGYTDGARGDNSGVDCDEQFANRLSAGRTVTELKTLLMNEL